MKKANPVPAWSCSNLSWSARREGQGGRDTPDKDGDGWLTSVSQAQLKDPITFNSTTTSCCPGRTGPRWPELGAHHPQPVYIFHVGIRSLVFFLKDTCPTWPFAEVMGGATADPTMQSVLILTHVFARAHFVSGQKPTGEGNHQQWCGRDCSPAATSLASLRTPAKGGISARIFSPLSTNDQNRTGSFCLRRQHYAEVNMHGKPVSPDWILPTEAVFLSGCFCGGCTSSAVVSAFVSVCTLQYVSEIQSGGLWQKCWPRRKRTMGQSGCQTGCSFGGGVGADSANRCKWLLISWGRKPLLWCHKSKFTTEEE